MAGAANDLAAGASAYTLRAATRPNGAGHGYDLAGRMKMLCVICDREVCGHRNAPRYLAEEDDFSPVKTETGEMIRQYALKHLGDRYRVLLENSTTYSFSPIEGEMLDETGRVLETLTAMRPVGPLIPDRREGRWAEAVLPKT